MLTLRATRMGTVGAAIATAMGLHTGSAEAQQRTLRFDTPPLVLASPIVTTLLQDREGLMWIGTQGGLIRYDGHAQTMYGATSTLGPALPSSTIRDIIESSDGRLWISTLSGLGILSADRDSLVEVTSDNRPDIFPVTDALSNLAELPDGRVAVGTDGGGLVIFGADGRMSQRYVHDPDDPESLPGDAIVDVLATGDGTLWVGARNGLARLAPGSDRFERISLPPGTDLLEEDEARRLAMDPEGVLWIGGLGGVVRLDPRTGETTRIALGADRVQTIMASDPDSVWVGSYGTGLYLLDREGRITAEAPPGAAHVQGLTDGRVSTLLQDRTGLIWVGLWGGGIQTTDPRGAAFAFLPTGSVLSGEEVTSISAGPDPDRMVVTTYGGGVNIVSNDGNLIQTIHATAGDAGEPSETLTALWSPGRDMLVGTMRRGVDVVSADGSMRSFPPRPADSLGMPDGTVYAFVRDAEDRVWVGTSLGLRRFDPATGQFHVPVTSSTGAALRNTFVRALHLDDNGYLWVATLGDGLFVFDPDSGRTEWLNKARYPGRIPDDEIAAVTTFGGFGWFGTRSAGTLHRVSDWTGGSPTIESVGPPEGLGGAIQCITPDSDGLLWLSTTSTVATLDPATLSLTRFGHADGLPGGELRTASCGLAPDGKVWFGMQTGATIFHPDSLNRERASVATAVSSVMLAGEEAMARSHRGVHRIPFRGGITSFHLAVLDYRSPTSQTFSYRLNGGAWVPLGTESTVSFVDLPPGRYTFEAQGRDAHGALARPTPPFRFEVLPPYYGTVWFRLAALVLAMLTVWTVFQVRTRRIRRHNAALRREITRRKRLEGQQAQLEAQLRQSQKMEAVGRLTGGIAHDFNNILTVLMANADLVLETTKDQEVLELVEEIRSSGAVAAELVSQLMVFSRKKQLAPAATDLAGLLKRLTPLLRRTLGGTIQVELDLADEAVILVDPSMMESAILNLCLNARDAMPSGGVLRLTVAARQGSVGAVGPEPPREWVVLTVADTGSGIAADQLDQIFEPFFSTKETGRGTGLGLSMVHGLVEQSGGHITVESTEGSGTRFHLHFPPVAEGNASGPDRST